MRLATSQLPVRILLEIYFFACSLSRPGMLSLADFLPSFVLPSFLTPAKPAVSAVPDSVCAALSIASLPVRLQYSKQAHPHLFAGSHLRKLPRAETGSSHSPRAQLARQLWLHSIQLRVSKGCHVGGDLCCLELSERRGVYGNQFHHKPSYLSEQR